VIEFMTAMIKGSEQKVCPVPDNTRAHHYRPVKQWLKENSLHIAVFHAPSYSPEPNHDEQLNADLKRCREKRHPSERGGHGTGR
jgi:hypothetical protein